MAVSPKRRSTDFQTATNLASLVSQVEFLSQQVSKVITHLEGNGRPGLLSRVQESEAAVQSLRAARIDDKEDLVKMEHDIAASLGRIEASLRDRLVAVETLAKTTNETVVVIKDTLTDHVSPDNSAHKTMFTIFQKNPRQAIKDVAVVILIVYAIYQSGVVPLILNRILDF